MPIIQIAPVTREGMRFLFSLYGMSETGKTLSALLLAAGIEPDPAKRGLLDSEGGERGRMYMDQIPGGYMYGSLAPPFTPERYTEALYDFVKAGVSTLVIDSGSHAWFAAGGVLDMVEQATEANAVAKWAKPKRRLGKMTGHWMQCGLHIIICARGKQPMIEVTKENGKKEWVKGDVVPIQEKSMRFDMTVIGLMLGDGLFTVERERGGKCPGALRPIFAAGEKMDIEMGRKLAAWLGNQDIITPEQREISMRARDVAMTGLAAYGAFWKALTNDQRKFLLPQHDNLKSIAATAEADTKRAADDAAEGAREVDLDAPFGADAGPAIPGGVKLATSDGDTVEAA